ncbi:LPS export ABC transporter periplasmic protein LptC [Photobacterium jeanii]|uniref:Lipopolysaccharide export system protein LptC n=1 Tax=Photobacterium jeanii TaxID=858640 RepID=A0A178KH61_9GAMM|nr:LPS export ABC transporter periplasmic protein LptC [Photobacterium jeanii]OAN16540.1 LPS export ABC transporter periplasmic protein LptC [Photobacterium jeanii]PST87932.1 LPS export ABC transporter periplasmic protein LptC [Photobacterium jeanii]
MTLHKLLYTFAFIVCVVTGFYLFDKYWQDDVQVTPDAEKPMFTGSVVTNTAYTEAGVRSYQVDSDYLEHFSSTGDTDFTKPVLWVFRDGSETEWRISSNDATLDQDQILYMKGNVRIFNLLPESTLKVIQTDTLRIDLISKDFDTSDHVTMTGDAFINEGDGMTGNMDRSVATLLKNVKGRYESIQN